jgi:hypothetical protein
MCPAYIGIGLAGNVTIQTGDIRMGMPAGRPVRDNTIILCGMTVYAALCFF